MPLRETGAERADQRPASGALPALAAALLAAVLSWFWLIPTVSALSANSPDGAAAPAMLAGIADTDIADALKTMSGSANFLAQFRKKKAGCPSPLAWVSIARMQGQDGQPLRLQSGRYLSPLFMPGDTPLRVAIPYPAPYETGHGELGVIGTGGGVVLALDPPWSTAAGVHIAVHRVRWIPSKHCDGGA